MMEKYTDLIKEKKRMGASWYIKLNIMVMGFLFVLFLMKQLNTSSFKAGLENIFSPGHSQHERSVRIKMVPKGKETKTVR